MYVWTMATRAGWVAAARSNTGLVALTLPQPGEQDSLRMLGELGIPSRYIIKPPGVRDELRGLEQALERYFGGVREDFRFTVDWSVYTPFQRKVLKIVRQIPYGSLLSYGQVAALAGFPRAARAAGGALGANRVLLVIPCHRVIRGDGTLGGFGGGLEWKSRLLSMEGITAGPGGRYLLGSPL